MEKTATITEIETILNTEDIFQLNALLDMKQDIEHILTEEAGLKK